MKVTFDAKGFRFVIKRKPHSTVYIDAGAVGVPLKPRKVQGLYVEPEHYIKAENIYHRMYTYYEKTNGST